MTKHNSTAQLSFDFSSARPDPVGHEDGRRARAARGSMSYHAGLAAEAQVAQDYERRGYPVARRRWRGIGGEIDLILRDGDGLIFVEVKKSRSFDQAMDHLSSRQVRRLQRTAEEFVGGEPRGSLTDMRFDVALVNGHGMIRVIENAYGP